MLFTSVRTAPIRFSAYIFRSASSALFINTMHNMNLICRIRALTISQSFDGNTSFAACLYAARLRRTAIDQCSNASTLEQ